MIRATEDFLQQIEVLAAQRRDEIRSTPDNVRITGTTYFVSNDGCDENDGLTPQTSWKTLNKVSKAPLQKGDGVLFRRGDLFRGFVMACSGVTYGAYGEGEKPKFYGWSRSLDDPALWPLYSLSQTYHAYIFVPPFLGFFCP